MRRGRVAAVGKMMLSPHLLRLLREWWKAARPQVWLFPGQNPINPVTARQLIPRLADQNPWAHLRNPMDMIFHGLSMSSFQASQQCSTIWS
jgi:hypothetical protein